MKPEVLPPNRITTPVIVSLTPSPTILLPSGSSNAAILIVLPEVAVKSTFEPFTV